MFLKSAERGDVEDRWGVYGLGPTMSWSAKGLSSRIPYWLTYDRTIWNTVELAFHVAQEIP